MIEYTGVPGKAVYDEQRNVSPVQTEGEGKPDGSRYSQCMRMQAEGGRDGRRINI